MTGDVIKVPVMLVPQSGPLEKMIAEGIKMPGVMGGTGGKGVTAGAPKILEKIAGELAKIGGISKGMFTKLGVIGVAVGVLSSLGPIVGILKMIFATLQIALRPIAELLLQVLKPIFILLLRWVIIPFYKYAMPFFQKSGKVLSDIASAITNINFGEAIGKIIGTENLEKLKDIGTWIYNTITGGISTGLNVFTSLGKAIYDNFILTIGSSIVILLTIGQAIYDIIKNTIDTSIKILSDIGTWFYDRIKSLLEVKNLSEFGKWIWDTITSALNLGFGIVKTIGKWIYDTLVIILMVSLKELETIGRWVYSILTNTASWGFGVLAGIGSWIMDTVKSFFTGGGSRSISGTRALGGPVLGGSSYLVGEKGPEIFTPGASGNITSNSKIGGTTLNITGNTFGSRSDIDYMVKEIEKKLYTNNKRAGNW